MVMDEGLIVREYEQSRDKNAQIAILADLNGCSVDEIMNVLIEAGVISGIKKKTRAPSVSTADSSLPEGAFKEKSAIPKAKEKRAEGVKWTPELDAEVSKLAREGLTQFEIGERLGISKQAIADRKRRLKLQAERLAGSFKKEKKEHVLPQSPSVTAPSRKEPTKGDDATLGKKHAFTMQKGNLSDTDVSITAEATRELRAEALGCGVLREIIEKLRSVGLEVTECNINVLERSFVISGVESAE